MRGKRIDSSWSDTSVENKATKQGKGAEQWLSFGLRLQDLLANNGGTDEWE